MALVTGGSRGLGLQIAEALAEAASGGRLDGVPLGILIPLLAGLAYLLRPRSHSMYWRGRRIDLDDRPGPTQKLYRRFFKR